MPIYLANDKFTSHVLAEYHSGDATITVDLVPDNVPTLLIANKGEANECVLSITSTLGGGTLTGVSFLKGADVNLEKDTILYCLNNEEFVNQYSTELRKANIDLANVDNTSDAAKNAAVADLTNKTLIEPVIEHDGVDYTTDGFLRHSMQRQALINSNFDIWQRRTTSPTLTHGVSVYTADHWYDHQNNGGGTLPTLTRTRERLITKPNDESYYYSRLTTNGAGTSLGAGSAHNYVQRIENGVRYLCGNGKKITVSFWARSDISGKKIGVFFYERYGTGGTPSSLNTLIGTNWTLSSSWKKYTYTFETTTLSGKTFGTDNNDCLQLCISYIWGDTYKSYVGSATAETYVGAGIIDITQVQVCSGEVALPYSPVNFHDELIACQRYYEKSIGYDTAPANGVSRHNQYGVYAYSTTNTRCQIPFITPKHTTPTITYYRTLDGGTAGQAAIYKGSWSDMTSTSSTTNNQKGFCFQANSTSLTAFSTYLMSVCWEAEAEIAV